MSLNLSSVFNTVPRNLPGILSISPTAAANWVTLRSFPICCLCFPEPKVYSSRRPFLDSLSCLALAIFSSTIDLSSALLVACLRALVKDSDSFFNFAKFSAARFALAGSPTIPSISFSACTIFALVFLKATPMPVTLPAKRPMPPCPRIACCSI